LFRCGHPPPTLFPLDEDEQPTELGNGDASKKRRDNNDDLFDPDQACHGINNDREFFMKLTGAMLKNRFRIDQLIGRGGMADVYKVWDSQRANYLAIKILRKDLANNRLFLNHFQREGHTLEQLQHPNIVHFYGLDQDGTMAFILMEYIEGSNLQTEITRLDGRAMALARILEILRPVCSALHFAHRSGIVHCDLKPANIIISKSGRVLVTDFGIAYMIDEMTETIAGMGTLAYMAPEQVRSETPTPQTDIYALGVILFEMLTGGKQPFTGEAATIGDTIKERMFWEQLNLQPPPARRYNPNLSSEIDALLMRCFAKAPGERYASALDLLNTFTQVSSGLSTTTALPLILASSPPPPPPPHQNEQARLKTPSSELVCPVHGPYDASHGTCPFCSGVAPVPPAPSPLHEDEIPTDLGDGYVGGGEGGGDDDPTDLGQAANAGADGHNVDDVYDPTELGQMGGSDEFTELDFEETGILGLLWVKEGSRRGQVFKIKDKSVVGRSEGDVILDDPKASKQHCRFRVEDDKFVLWDLATKNGTYVNGVKIRGATELRENDEINIGIYSFIFKIMGDSNEYKEPTSDAVDLSLTAPQMLSPGQAYIVDVWMHLPEQRGEVESSARSALDGAAPHIRSRHGVQVARGTLVKVRLRLSGFSIEETEDTVYWNGSAVNATFPVKVPTDITMGSHNGVVTLFVDELQIARLNFTLVVGSQDLPPARIPSQTRWVHSAFVSYAHEDADEVLRRVQGIMKGNPGLDLFLDSISLRSGENWNKSIPAEIKKRDILYLFWSQTASQSTWVEFEWRLALDEKGLEGIDPVPLESPVIAPPPKELAALHFNDVYLSFLNDTRSTD
jgi:serine/threonine protein kinase